MEVRATEQQARQRGGAPPETSQHSPLGGRLRWSYIVVGVLLVGGLLRNAPLLLLGLLLGLVVFAAWLWAKYALSEITYSRVLSEHRIFYKEPLTITCAVTNNKPLPVPKLQIEDNVPNELRLDNV